MVVMLILIEVCVAGVYRVTGQCQERFLTPEGSTCWILLRLKLQNQPKIRSHLETEELKMKTMEETRAERNRFTGDNPEDGPKVRPARLIIVLTFR